tara:strand:- start:112 stop:312 length:201 start_codon:yes stop_codon:yes gene_type:complete
MKNKIKTINIGWNDDDHLKIAEIIMEAEDNISCFDGCKEMAKDLFQQDPKEVQKLLKTNNNYKWID